LLPASIAASPAMRAWKSFKLHRGFRERTVHRLVEEINDMDAATNLSELGNLRSTGLHKLKGNRRGQWAMTINRRWRLCFEFSDGDAFNVEIVDYHRG